MIKNVLVLPYAMLVLVAAKAQSGAKLPPILITAAKEETGVRVNQNGTMQVNVSPGDRQKYKAQGYVCYNDLGAKGDGRTDDIDIIAATHAFANQEKLAVKAMAGATYYIGGRARTAVIQTNTDFGTAAFIIDDTQVQDRQVAVFEVTSDLKPFKIKGIATLRRNQQKLDTSFPATCLVTVTNTAVRQYMRLGLNRDNGAAQTDIFIVDKNGNVDMNAPIIWDFDNITDLTAVPVEESRLSITGGHFTTLANQAPSNYTYYARNMVIRRSNVWVEGLEHRITGEGVQGAPYQGFISISNCAYVTAKDVLLTGHKTYRTIGSAGDSVAMGSYDLSINRALNVSILHGRQTNDITDNRFWGIMGSNYCKNLLYDDCIFSRFDAHKGVANATIRNSTLGYMGINAIGSGTLTVENSRIYGGSLVNLRNDYGSSWQGEFIIRNCVFVPGAGRAMSAALISGTNTGQHDFGYTCYMPERITIENLEIDDANHPAGYQGPAIFGKFNPAMTDSTYTQAFPYITTRIVVVRNVTTTSGKALRLSDNSYMFRNVKVDGW